MTASGVQTLPLVVGLLVTSILSGTIIGRTGRYKVFPVAGSLLMGLGLWLLSLMDAGTSFWLMAAYMLIVDAYAHSLHLVFLFAVPVAGLSFVLALFLKEVPPRDTAKAGAADVGGGFGLPERAESLQQLQTAIARVMPSRGRPALAEIRDASGTGLDVANGWCVGAVYLRARLDRDTSVAAIAHRHRLPAPVLHPAFQQARAAGFLTGDDDHLRLTETGRREIDNLVAATHTWLRTELRDWGSDDDQLLRQAMAGIARQIVDQEPQPAPQPAAAARD